MEDVALIEYSQRCLLNNFGLTDSFTCINSRLKLFVQS